MHLIEGFQKPHSLVVQFHRTVVCQLNWIIVLHGLNTLADLGTSDTIEIIDQNLNTIRLPDIVGCTASTQQETTQEKESESLSDRTKPLPVENSKKRRKKASSLLSLIDTY